MVSLQNKVIVWCTDFPPEFNVSEQIECSADIEFHDSAFILQSTTCFLHLFSKFYVIQDGMQKRV